MIHASCHCGSVQLEIARKPRSLTECTCSICRRYGARWAYYTRKSVRVVCDAQATSVYTWGSKTLEFHHCRTCGCLTHYESVTKGPDSRVAVNARMMEPDDIGAVPVKLLDGAVTWKYVDRR